MTNFRNLKIAITPEQKLGEVVSELERIGYSTDNWYFDSFPKASVICACIGGVIMDLVHMSVDHDKLKKYKLTTLTELKNME